MLHLICLTKTYRLDDFECWLKFHQEPTTKIYVIDNESFENSDTMRAVCMRYDANYQYFKGFPDQWNLFSSILNGKTDITFEENDVVMFLDDDEFLWYDKSLYSSLECALRAQFKMLGCLLIPEILLSTHHLTEGRSDVCPLACYYRRNDRATQGKAAVLWAPWETYSFNYGDTEIGHVPWVNKRRFSDVVGSDVSKTTYGLCDYDAPVRLYHYHIKSLADWKVKIERGSAAAQSEEKKNGNYDEDITKDKKYGGYKVPDFTMKTAWEKINSKSI